MRYFCSFTSGSKGNSAIYVSPGAKILIDAGSSAKYITSCLSKLGLCPGDLTHIVLTHAHSDHISALPVLSKYTDARLVCSEDTYDQLPFAKGEPLLFAEGDSFELLVNKDIAELITSDPRYSSDFSRVTIDKMWSSPVIADDGTVYISFTDDAVRTIAGVIALAYEGTDGPADSEWPMLGQNARHTSVQPE